MVGRESRGASGHANRVVEELETSANGALSGIVKTGCSVVVGGVNDVVDVTIFIRGVAVIGREPPFIVHNELVSMDRSGKLQDDRKLISVLLKSNMVLPIREGPRDKDFVSPVIPAENGIHI